MPLARNKTRNVHDKLELDFLLNQQQKPVCADSTTTIEVSDVAVP